MKEKGFTLIELLAVIVILAIIALIATPIVLNIIKESEEESNKRSVEMYAKAIKNANTSKQLDGSFGITGKFETSTLEDKLKVEYEGNVVCEVIEIYEDGSIFISDCIVNGEPVEYTYGKKQTYNNGQIVYFDIFKGIRCTEKEYKSSYDEDVGDYLNSKTGYNGYTNKDSSNNEINKLEKQNSCLKFYAFLDAGSDKINLLLDHNTTYHQYWTVSTDPNKENWDKGLYNADGPITLLRRLYTDTSKWNVPEISKDYIMNQTNQLSNANYTIEYTKTDTYYGGSESAFKARLIEAQEIAQITGADKEPLNWKEESSDHWYYLDGVEGIDEKWQKQVSNTTNQSNYYWLFDRTSNCKKYGCVMEEIVYTDCYGYWTSASLATDNREAWAVFHSGNIHPATLDFSSFNGIRPVIEVLKSSLK